MWLSSPLTCVTWQGRIMWWWTAYLGPRGALPAQVYPGGQHKGALRVTGRPCGTGWEIQGLYSGSSGGPCYPAGAHQMGRTGT